EDDLARARLPEPSERRKAPLDRLRGGDRAALQRNDDRLRIGDFGLSRRHIDQLHGAHAAPHQCVAQIGGASEIVGDRSQQHAHRAPPPGLVLKSILPPCRSQTRSLPCRNSPPISVSSSRRSGFSTASPPPPIAASRRSNTSLPTNIRPK